MRMAPALIEGGPHRIAGRVMARRPNGGEWEPRLLLEVAPGQWAVYGYVTVAIDDRVGGRPVYRYERDLTAAEAAAERDSAAA